ncbi:unnamed protein product [Diamesa serratosioi]
MNIKFVRSSAIRNFENSCNVFALEWFDDTDDDCMLPNDWINKCEINGKKFQLPGIAFLPLSTDTLDKCSYTDNSDLTVLYEWQHVAVYDYNHISNKWFIKDIKHNNSYTVPRIYLMFMAESPMNFARRISKAIKLRDECEINLKFNAIIDSIVFTEIPRPPQHLTKAILQPLLKRYNAGWIDIFEREYTILYQKDMAAMQLKHNLHTDPHGFDFIQLPLAQSTNEREMLLKMKQNKNNNKNINANKESFNFTKAQLNLKWLWLYCSPEPIQVMYFINKMCRTVSQMSLFSTECKKTVTLIEFCDAQNKIATETMHFLKYNWNSAIATEMQVIFSDIRQGWYNMCVTDWEIYKQSKLYRMIQMVKQRMQVALRTLMEYSAEAFVDLLCKPCECLLNIDNDFVWGCDLVSSSFQSKCPSAVFSLILILDANGTSYSTDPYAIESEIVKIFESTVLALHEIPQIDPFLVTRLTFDRNIKMSSVGLLDVNIQDRINHLQLCYQKSLIPLLAYAKEFERYVEFKSMSINEYIKSIKVKSSQEIKEEINFQLKAIEELEVNLPANIIIGPYSINVNLLKQSLIAKRQELYKKLKLMFCDILKEKIEDIFEKFETIQNRLTERNKTIEQLYDTKEWMLSVPENVRVIEEKMRKIFFDFDILETFLMPLSNELLKLKWNTLAFPIRIMRLLNDTRNQFDNDEISKFRKIQLNDETNFLEKFDGLTIECESYSSNYDIDDLSVVSIGIDRLWNNLNEMLTHGHLLNKRQNIFNNPDIVLEPLKKLIEHLEPYYKLWTMALNFMEWKEKWTQLTVISIDIVNIKLAMNECKKVFHKCLLNFVDNMEMLKVVEHFLKALEYFETQLKIIEHLKNPNFLLEHWLLLIQQSGMTMKYNPNLTFDYLMMKGILQNAKLVEDISAQATSEKEAKLKAEIEREKNRLRNEEIQTQKHSRLIARTDI